MKCGLLLTPELLTAIVTDQAVSYLPRLESSRLDGRIRFIVGCGFFRSTDFFNGLLLILFKPFESSLY